ncbi:hypothetical protein Unana1_03874 [Umbelopsis nana]
MKSSLARRLKLCPSAPYSLSEPPRALLPRPCRRVRRRHQAAPLAADESLVSTIDREAAMLPVVRGCLRTRASLSLPPILAVEDQLSSLSSAHRQLRPPTPTVEGVTIPNRDPTSLSPAVAVADYQLFSNSFHPLIDSLAPTAIGGVPPLPAPINSDVDRSRSTTSLEQAVDRGSKRKMPSREDGHEDVDPSGKKLRVAPPSAQEASSEGRSRRRALRRHVASTLPRLSRASIQAKMAQHQIALERYIQESMQDMLADLAPSGSTILAEASDPLVPSIELMPATPPSCDPAPVEQNRIPDPDPELLHPNMWQTPWEPEDDDRDSFIECCAPGGSPEPQGVDILDEILCSDDCIESLDLFF